MKKVLIVNAVPTNNGDAALVFGLRDKLIKNGYDVTISTKRYNIVKKLYPDIKWIKADDDFNKFERLLKKIIPVKVLLNLKVRLNSKYKVYDTIISAPGGYVNSYYGFYERFYCMSLIKKLYNTKLVMYSQSVGPLNSNDKTILEKFIEDFDLFMVRDDVSYENVKQYSNVIQTNDAAFLLNSMDIKKEKSNTVGISVRQWNHDNRSREKYINNIIRIAATIIENGYSVEFISTCQGISSYIDDSQIAKDICEKLEEKYKHQVKVIDRYFSLNDLREYITKYEFVIGTRLHMCILSIISGVPAFNISYEIKGKECYKKINMSDYSIDYNGEISDIIPKVQRFIDNNEQLREEFKNKYILMNDEANKHFKYMTNKVIEK